MRPMTRDEFDVFLSRAIDGYAEAHVVSGEWHADDAQRLAAEETNSLLPEGLETPGMLFLVAEDGGVVVGRAWLALEQPGKPGAWIYDIEVESSLRGKGYGRELLAAVERTVAEHGTDTLGLNVFAENAVARRLYETAGYAATSLHMQKTLS
jgi:GNAT superfamily N-acetyltransferase